MGAISKRFIAVAAAGLMFGAAVAAPTAQAYPPGTKAEVFTNKTAFKPGTAVKSKAENVQPGCMVKFAYKGRHFKKTVTTKANKNGVAKTRLKHGPKKAGKYEVRITVKAGQGKRCLPATSTTKFKVFKSSGGLG